jgi:NADH dehydrogenase/NADH:ubiquinone oxidoreductase subunit G
MTMVKMKLNGKAVEAGETMTALDLARAVGVDIPTLCRHEALGPYGACRLCVVEAEGPMLRRSLVASCTLPVSEGLVVETETPQVQRARKVIFELLLGRSESESLRKLAKRYGVESTRFKAPKTEDCVRCALCVRACRSKIGVSAISFAGRGQKRRVTAEFGKFSENCIGCGACAAVCPTQAITLRDEGDTRVIRMKDRVIAEHKLERCIACGTPFAPQKYLAFVSGRTADHPVMKRSARVCQNCSRLRAAETAAGEIPAL